HKTAVPSSEQKLCINQCTEQRIASGPVEAPEPLRLRRRQPQPGHLDVFALDASQYVVKRLCWHLSGSPIPNLSSRCRGMSNAHATAVRPERLSELASDHSRNRAHFVSPRSATAGRRSFRASESCIASDVLLSGSVGKLVNKSVRLRFLSSR